MATNEGLDTSSKSKMRKRQNPHASKLFPLQVQLEALMGEGDLHFLGMKGSIGSASATRPLL